MSLTGVLKNIYSYLEVVQASTTDVVGSWCKESLQNALQWARYCQQIYDKSKGKSYANELDRQIAALGRIPMGLGDTVLSLEYFDGCVLKLTMNLIQNPYLSDELLDELFKANNGNLDTVLEGCFSLSEVKAELQLSCLLSEEINGSDKVTKDGAVCLTLKAHALLLYDHVKTAMNNTSDKESVEKYLLEKLDKVVEESDGLVLLLESCLLAEDGSDSEVAGAAARNFLLHFIIRLVDEMPLSSGHRKPQDLLKIDGQILTAMSTKYHSFFQAYLRYLAKMIDTKGEEEADFLRVTNAVSLMLNCEPYIASGVLQWLEDNNKRTGSQSNSWTKLIQGSRKSYQPG